MRIFAHSNPLPRNTGQLHPKAKLSDHEVELIRKLREDDHWTYGQLARKFEVSKNCIVRICRYRSR